MYTPNEQERITQRLIRDTREFLRHMEQILAALEANQDKPAPRREFRPVRALRRGK